MKGTITRSNAARMISVLAEVLQFTDRGNVIDFEVNDEGNIWIDDHLAASIKESE